ncbi:nucleotide-diphospho-sugar transferase [Dactylonectria macrodidyma]|uniref:Nucleotide-diphospho-sugar transferase n=1 Tax=Dactylonectria macrodidyma TaxID=307937 RepID=A0A9P9DX56_9HYPO|nr:nucleotide-diphospho-sugar transferase [Dactylonectria macrodidyma]
MINTNSSPTRATSSSSSSSPSSNNKPFDEEWGSVPRWSTWPKKLRIPRLRKVTVILGLIDIAIVLLLVHAFEPLITLLRRNEELFGARLTLPLNDTVAEHANSDNQTIPRIFHQTAATDKVPDAWVASHKSCQDAYSKFEYKYWTDEKARDFIDTEYNWFLDTWDNLPFNIQRADAIRYFVLYHFGGIYLDMDTLCNNTIPFALLEADGTEHHAVFKSTTPTGVSNDLMISSARHPVLKAAITRLPFFVQITRPWANLLPHAAVMVSAGPFFLTQVIKDYLLELPELPSSTISVINETELIPYITDLEGRSWHHGDTKTLMWLGDRPWIWFALGAVGLAIGLHIINHLLLLSTRCFCCDPTAGGDYEKIAKQN